MTRKRRKILKAQDIYVNLPKQVPGAPNVYYTSQEALDYLKRIGLI
jgi:hypothetical protein